MTYHHKPLPTQGTGTYHHKVPAQKPQLKLCHHSGTPQATIVVTTVPTPGHTSNESNLDYESQTHEPQPVSGKARVGKE
ncbi:hypothetical protein Taro_013847 [Colocasia esculenta]|uniref:Uncharacterized protein n=1 Tax=Colocasia esculenta TaxID=4460 RepID=A0A843UGN9_COLES|nr:hypothetical protein [Colocasia esculenta]